MIYNIITNRRQIENHVIEEQAAEETMMAEVKEVQEDPGAKGAPLPRAIGKSGRLTDRVRTSKQVHFGGERKKGARARQLAESGRTGLKKSGSEALLMTSKRRELRVEELADVQRKLKIIEVPKYGFAKRPTMLDTPLYNRMKVFHMDKFQV